MSLMNKSDYLIAKELYEKDEVNINEVIKKYIEVANDDCPETYYDLACIYMDHPNIRDC